MKVIKLKESDIQLMVKRVLTEQEDPSYDELSGKQKDLLKNAVYQYTQYNNGHYRNKQSKVKFSDGSMWEVPEWDREIDDTTIKLKNLATGETKYVNYASSENLRENWSYIVRTKKGDYEYPILGWPEEIYGGYLGQSLYLDREWNINEGEDEFWPRKGRGKWTDEVVWRRNGGLTQKFINNEPNNPWDCIYEKFKQYADNEKSKEYPNGIWEPLKKRADELNYDLDPSECK